MAGGNLGLWTALLACACVSAHQPTGGSRAGQGGPGAEQKRYETTVPLQLVGQEWKAMHLLQSQNHPTSLKLRIEAEGRQLRLRLRKNQGLFASDYKETHYLRDGTAVTGSHNSLAHCYYHGEVERHPDSDVSLSTCNSTLKGLISVDGRSYMVEPAAHGTHGTHWIYSTQHLHLTSGTCGHPSNGSEPLALPDGDPFKSFSTRHKRHIQSTTKYVELIIVADNREFQKQGKDVEKVKQRLAEIANYVDKFYRALNIRVALVGLEVWSDMDKCPVTQDPFTTLHEFLDWRKVKLLPRKAHDNAQLISGVYFQGTTIGMAPIMSMCTAEQSGGIVMDHSDNPLGAAVTLAHELGHNFGMNHDTPERGCGCRVTAQRGGCIMTPSTGYPFPTVFSSCSKTDLVASLDKGVGMCLFNMPEVKVLYGGQKCGNGYVEEGEECDCGELEECLNPCCNATTCTLKGHAVCAHGQCCHDCQLKPAGTPCRGSGNSCDLPEFCTGVGPHCPANVYLHDGHACSGADGYCYNGVCQTHEQQCVTLWGRGAKAAPGICFERVNSAGDPYGNCGKDAKGSFAKCDARDAQCGKVQCQGGANRPVIGTNAVSIETNIPLQDGGRILCRGTHVYLGDDMPDPGLVLTGTKCGGGMMCLNRRCQNVSVFGVHECAAKCNGRGVCNNNKNCHCEAHRAPPFCDTSGFGGSVDSGPVRLADGIRVTVGVLAVLLSLVGAAVVVCIKWKSLRWVLSSTKKDPIDKLRSVKASTGAASTPKRDQPTGAPSPSRPAPPLPHSATIFKPPHRGGPQAPPPPPYPSHSLHRLPQYQPFTLSVSLGPAPPPPAPHLRPHVHVAVARSTAGAFAGLNVCNTEAERPGPPQKPLPADPRTSHPALGPRPRRPHPAKSVAKQPATLPKPRVVANVKYSR
ncbi:disintegrin and metalloproteinase domain-containing protein 12-like isoform X2 [Syngnathus typhle]|uniref:disintegrin and metalloproteinase domain-containing protein 12-like isoform X2 n=1 Tax=Syngnathus typhle TaxID=161592 RepID=UPI002A6A9734|nr:disintegrin and metalloproteinase domain-containing protein 12-like isoform X2 [Syngnathus typhle]